MTEHGSHPSLRESSLSHRIKWHEAITDGASLEGSWSNGWLNVEVSNNVARSTFQRYVADAEEHAALVTQTLNSWASLAELETRRPACIFYLIDYQIWLPDIGKFSVAGTLTIPLRVQRSAPGASLPAVLPSRVASPLVREFATRYSESRASRDALIPAAYMCLTLVEQLLGPGRTRAAQALGVSDERLKQLGKLTATPDLKLGRKVTADWQGAALDGPDLEEIRSILDEIADRLCDLVADGRDERVFAPGS